MAASTQRRRYRQRLDQNLTTAATPAIKRVLKREGARVRAATKTATTPAQWERLARKAVSDREWVKAVIDLWTSSAMQMVWDEQQEALGTSIEMTADARKILIGYATEHGKLVAAARREHLSALVRANTPAALE